jgi:thiol-disulfide isomerase/thioredoxin
MAKGEVAQAKASPSAQSESWTLWIAGGLIALACLAGMIVLPRLGRAAKSHDPAPAFTLPVVLNGDPGAPPAFTLPVVLNGDPGARMSLADLKGKPVLIDFWAYWCGPCRMQGPIVDRVAAKYKDRGLTVLGVSVDGDRFQVTEGAKQAHMTYPVLTDETGEVQRAYHATNLPMLVLIDGDGKIVNSTQGLVDEASLDAMVREAL